MVSVQVSLGHCVLSDERSVVCCCEWSGCRLFSCGMHGVLIVDSFQLYLHSSYWNARSL